MDRGVFISYRGEDSHSYGALLYTELARQFGKDQVFLDAEFIPAGADFSEELLGRVRSSRVLLAVIGPRWLTTTDPTGRRQIDNPDDWIRRELAEAFAAGVQVIPVLTEHAEIPAEADLPADIAALSRLQYRHLRSREPTADLARIVADLTSFDPDLAAAAHSRDNAPRQLPVAPRLFTGRAIELSTLTDAASTTQNAGVAAVILAQLAGGRTDVLREAKADATRFAATGAILICGAILAAVSGFFTVRFGLNHLPWPVAGVLGIGWGGVEFALNRFMLVSIRRGGTTVSRAFGALTRIVVLLLIGLITAVPLILAIFHSEIEAQLAVMRTQDAQNIELNLKQSNSTISVLMRQEFDLQSVLTGRSIPTVANDPQVKAATDAYNTALKDYETAENAALCELDGTCGSGLPGAGLAFKQKQAAANSARAALEQAQKKLNDVSVEATIRLGKVVSQEAADRAQQQLAGLQPELADVTQQQAQAATADSEQDTGLLAQLTALREITDSHRAADVTVSLLLALFTLVQSLPVLLRLVAMARPPTLYERIVDRHEAEASERATRRERRVATLLANALASLDRQRAAIEMTDDSAAYQRLLARPTEVAERAVAAWAAAAETPAAQKLTDQLTELVGQLGLVEWDQWVKRADSLRHDLMLAQSEVTAVFAPREHQRNQSRWQVITDGVGSVFGLFGGTRVPYMELPSFEATLGPDVDRLWQILATEPTATVDQPVPSPDPLQTIDIQETR